MGSRHPVSGTRHKVSRRGFRVHGSRFSVSGFPRKVLLKDGRIALIDLLSKDDGAQEMLSFINNLILEGAFLTFDKPFSIEAQIEYLSGRMEALRKKTGFLLVARVDGKLAGTSSAGSKEGKARGNVEIGIAVSKGFRGIGLGEALLSENISLTKRLLKPKNLFLTVFSKNGPARSLYRKLGFKEFAIFPKWVLHRGGYMDLIHMRLD